MGTYLFTQGKIKRINVTYLEKYKILLKQSGFRPGDSCTNQLLSIANEILSAFDDSHEVRGVFLDISKAFDRVWHERLLFKLHQKRILGELITLIDFSEL